MVFAFPIAFWGLASLGVLGAVYWFRNRSRRYVVSSLSLWYDQREAFQGGRRIQRMQTPLLFFLELLALMFLVIAASGPRVRSSVTRDVIVIMDDSYSMLAGTDENSRDRAIEFINEELQGENFVARFILAGSDPQVLNVTARNENQITQALKKWNCKSHTTQIPKSIALAKQLAKKNTRIIILTDNKPEEVPSGGDVIWAAFGQPTSNTAFVNARRTAYSDKQKILLEIANFSDEGHDVKLDLDCDAFKITQRKILKIPAGKTSKLTFELPQNAGKLSASLNSDELAIDNKITLLAEQFHKASVKVQVSEPALDKSLKNVVNASRRALITKRTPEILITDMQGNSGMDNNTWIVRIIKPDKKNISCFTGPFITDRSHLLTEGILMDSVIWAADKNVKLKGRPVVMVADTVLLSDSMKLGNKHELQMQLLGELSTLTQDANWPILFENLFDWRCLSQLGPQQVNVRLGWNMLLRVGADVNEVTVVQPDLTRLKLPVNNSTVSIQANQDGVFDAVTDSGKNWKFSCNVLNPQESDVLKTSSGVWGGFDDFGIYANEYVSITFIPALLALTVLAIHMILLSRMSKGGTK